MPAGILTQPGRFEANSGDLRGGSPSARSTVLVVGEPRIFVPGLPCARRVFTHLWHNRLAQLTLNQWVPGSSPGGCTIYRVGIPGSTEQFEYRVLLLGAGQWSLLEAIRARLGAATVQSAHPHRRRRRPLELSQAEGRMTQMRNPRALSIESRPRSPGWSLGTRRAGTPRRDGEPGSRGCTDCGKATWPVGVAPDSVAQLVSAPPCHGGGRGFEPRQGRKCGRFDSPGVHTSGRIETRHLV